MRGAVLVVVEVATQLVLGVVAHQRAELVNGLERGDEGDHDEHAEDERRTHGPTDALGTEDIGLHSVSVADAQPRLRCRP